MERIPKRKRRGGTCADCGGNTTKSSAVRCAKCNYIFRRKHPDRDEYSAEWHRCKKYGLEKGEFDALWIVFKGRCGICGNELKRPAKTRGQQLDVVAIDHCHVTNRVRGLLCNACNKGLGYFKDNPESLRNAIKWLTR